MERVTINRCSFSELFHFAEKEYGISWNECNNLFFSQEHLTYQRINNVNISELLDGIDLAEYDPDYENWDIDGDFENWNRVAWAVINKGRDFVLNHEIKLYLIIAHFLLVNNVNDTEIDCT